METKTIDEVEREFSDDVKVSKAAATEAAAAEAGIKARVLVSPAVAAMLAYEAGRRAVLDAPPAIGSVEWSVSKLQGRAFARQSEASEYLRRELEADLAAARAAAEELERARAATRSTYRVTLEVDVDADASVVEVYSGSPEVDRVERAIARMMANYLEEALPSGVYLHGGASDVSVERVLATNEATATTETREER